MRLMMIINDKKILDEIKTINNKLTKLEEETLIFKNRVVELEKAFTVVAYTIKWMSEAMLKIKGGINTYNPN